MKTIDKIKQANLRGKLQKIVWINDFRQTVKRGEELRYGENWVGLYAENENGTEDYKTIRVRCRIGHVKRIAKNLCIEFTTKDFY